MSELTLVEFILARLDEDEAVARAAVEASDRFWRLNVDSQGDWISDFDNGTPLLCGYAAHEDRWGKDRDSKVIAHAARHDPARVLVEVQAKRAIMQIHWEDSPDKDWRFCVQCSDDENLEPFPCATLRLLASVFSDHPDYRQEWTP